MDSIWCNKTLFVTLTLAMTSVTLTLTLNLADVMREPQKGLELINFNHQNWDSTQSRGGSIYSSSLHASDFLRAVNNELRQWKHGMAEVGWRYKTNVTNTNLQKLTKLEARYQSWLVRRQEEARQIPLQHVPPTLQRQIRLFRKSANSKNLRVVKRISDLKGRMEAMYSSGFVCLNKGSCKFIEPGLSGVMAQSRDPDILKQAWLRWRDRVGRRIRLDYVQFLQLLDVSAKQNGYRDYSEYWKEELFDQTPELDHTLQRLWEEVRPLYLQLHAYVRRKLRLKYGEDVMGSDGTIPAHLLGNMWAQHWTNIMDVVGPYPEADQQREVEVKLKSSWDPLEMFLAAEDLYRSMGLFTMLTTFWNKSMFQRPQGRRVVCHASATDFYYPGDFRIKMCAQPTLNDFLTVHHEMGHINYFMAYAYQPTIFRDGANAAFQEAIGDTIGLSALSTSHLSALGLLEDNNISHNYVDDDDDRHNGMKKPTVNNGEQERKEGSNAGTMTTREKAVINKLLAMALEKVAFLPFGYIVDKWRWDVMSGQTAKNELNRQWWKLRLEYQGVRAPVARSESDFDPGAKYHIPAHSPYVSYFISYIMQFQFFEALCTKSGRKGYLHDCDLHGAHAAGSKLRHVLTQGSSTPWQQQLEQITGSRNISAQALLNYFRPLLQWLTNENFAHGETPGWDGAEINWAS